MNRMAVAELTVLLELDPVRIVLLVLHSSIIPLLAIGTCQCDDLARCGLCHGENPPCRRAEGPIVRLSPQRS